MSKPMIILAAWTVTTAWAQDKTVQLTHGGASRSFLLHLPTGYDSTQAYPLVLDFHGLSGTSSQQAGWSGWRGEADQSKFLVAWPQGIGNSWNVGGCCSPASDDDVDDVGFAKAIVTNIKTAYKVDAQRIYATGFSNGGMMTYLLASEASDVFAAAAVCAGAMFSSASPSRPFPVIHIHGYDDEVLPYEGMGGRTVPSTLQTWTTVNKCQAGPQTEELGGRNKCETWSSCDGGVKTSLCSIEGTHAIYRNPDDISVAEKAWAFLSQFTLSGAAAILPSARGRIFEKPAALAPSAAWVGTPQGYLPNGRALRGHSSFRTPADDELILP